MLTFAHMEKQKRKTYYTPAEERWNTWSHAFGIVLGVVMGVFYLNYTLRYADGWATLGVVLYLFGMLMSYISSTAYHAMPAQSEWKKRLRKWDHAAIYWHIAGSYAPITLISLRDQGYWGWGLFCFVWGCALAGTIASFVRLKDHSNLETLCFCLMGLSVLVAFKPLMQNVSTTAIAWIIADGVCYLTGAVFYSLNKRRFMHTVFHFFVLAGTVCYMVAVWNILVKSV